jgi:hypothetical protein
LFDKSRVKILEIKCERTYFAAKKKCQHKKRKGGLPLTEWEERLPFLLI